MKNILLLLLLSCFIHADIKLTEDLIDNDLGTEQYQLFITNTTNIPLDGLEARVTYNGEMQQYLEKKIKKYPASISKYEKQAKEFSKLETFFGGEISVDDYDLDEYIKVIKYFDNNILKTIIIKYLVSEDDIDKEEQEVIFNTTNDTSYHYNEGEISIMFTTKRELLNYKERKNDEVN